MKKMLFILTAIILSACNTVQVAPVATSLKPAPSLVAEKIVVSTAQPLQDTPIPTTTAILSIDTPVPVGVTPMPLPRLVPGSLVVLDSIHMIDAEIGWGTNQDGRVLQTRDGGNTWQDVTPQDDLMSCTQIYFSNVVHGAFFLDAQTAWLVRCKGEAFNSIHLLRTTDGGQTWAVMTEKVPGFGLVMSLNFANKDEGWVEAYDVGAGHGEAQFSRTQDGGATWSQLMFAPSLSYGRLPNFPGDLAVCNICGDVIYHDPVRTIIAYGDEASSPSGVVSLALTTDLGKSWKQLAIPLPSAEYSNYYIVPNSPVFFDQNNGLLPVNMKNYAENFKLISESLAFYATHDGGLSWKLAGVEPKSLHLTDIHFISPQEAIALCGNGRLCVSRDGMSTWTAIKTVAWEKAQFDFVSGQVGWAIVQSGDATALVHTIDGGKTWTEIKPTVAASPQILSNTIVSDIHMFNETSGWAFGYSVNDSNYSYYYLHTADGGKTWVDKTPKGVSSFCANVSLDAQTAWLINCNDQPQSWALLRTSDGGDSWAPVNENLPYSRGASLLEFVSKSDGWIETFDGGAGSAFIKLSATRDGGRTWKPVVIEGPYAEMGNSTRLCSICEDSFYYDPLRVILGFGDMGSMNPSGKVSLSMSMDLGKSWNDLALPLPSAAFNDYLVTPLSPIFFSQNDGVMPVSLVKETDTGFTHSLAFYTTSDGGKNWKAAPAALEKLDQCDIRVEAVSLTDIFVGCGNALHITHDGAQSWLTSSVNPEPGVQTYLTQLDFVSANTGWAILTMDNNATILLMTTDGGRTWAVLKPAFLP